MGRQSCLPVRSHTREYLRSCVMAQQARPSCLREHAVNKVFLSVITRRGRPSFLCRVITRAGRPSRLCDHTRSKILLPVRPHPKEDAASCAITREARPFFWCDHTGRKILLPVWSHWEEDLPACVIILGAPFSQYVIKISTPPD